MPVDFQWDDADQRVMHYRVEGKWDWNQFHKTLRRSTLRFDEVEHEVGAIIDLRRSGQPMPAGAVGHLRSLLTSLAHVRFSGRAVVIGVDTPLLNALGVRDGVLRTQKGLIGFATDEDAARALLKV